MKQYTDLLKNIIANGVEKESGRANMPNTIGISKSDISHDLANGFPLLTTKKMYWKGVLHELLWFLNGDTNIKYLVDNKVNIWNKNAYRWYEKHYDKHHSDRSLIMSPDEFINVIKTKGAINPFTYETGYKLGDLGKVYGYQWRNQNGVDQVAELINGLQNNPYSRYHVIDAWNKADFKDMALPPCHLMYQFIVRPLTETERFYYAEKIRHLDGSDFTEFEGASNLEILNIYNIPKFYLDLNMYQRSCDTALGVPFNVASCAFLLSIISNTCNMIPGILNWIGGDTHLYITHIDNAKIQSEREPYPLPFLSIRKDLNNLNDILSLKIEDFSLDGYTSHPAIDYELYA